MRPRRGARGLALGIGLVVPAVVAAALALRGANAGRDYVQFHAAAELIRGGESPYGVEAQARVQGRLRAGEPGRGPEPGDPYAGVGVLPYFYPPWLALACVPLTALGYATARGVWVYLGAQGLVASGYGAGRVAGWRPAAGAAVALGVMPGLACVRLGQTPPLVLAGLVAACLLLDRGRDRLAGAALAWAVVKPQLAVVAVPAALAWSARRGRWGVVGGFGATLGALGLAAAAVVPDWPLEMLRAPTRLPVPTAVDPSVGVTWLSALRTAAPGVSGVGLALGYAAAAVPAALAALRAAWDRSRPAADPVALGLIAAFLVAPYALGYDLAALSVPLVVLLPRLTPRAAGWSVAVALAGPYGHLAAVEAGARPVTLLAWPLALAALWAWGPRS